MFRIFPWYTYSNVSIYIRSSKARKWLAASILPLEVHSFHNFVTTLRATFFQKISFPRILPTIVGIGRRNFREDPMKNWEIGVLRSWILAIFMWRDNLLFLNISQNFRYSFTQILSCRFISSRQFKIRLAWKSWIFERDHVL